MVKLDQFVLTDVEDGRVKTEILKVLGLIADMSEDEAVREAAAAETHIDEVV